MELDTSCNGRIRNGDFEMKHAVVTGGSGFLGSHLSKRLLSEGDKVTVLDNFNTGSKDNGADGNDNPAFTRIEHNVIQPFRVDGLVDGVKMLAVVAVFCNSLPTAVRTALLVAVQIVGPLRRSISQGTGRRQLCRGRCGLGA